MKRLLYAIPLLWQLTGLPALAAVVCTTAMPAHCCCCQHGTASQAGQSEMANLERAADAAVLPACPCVAPASPDTDTTQATPVTPNHRAPADAIATITLPHAPSGDACGQAHTQSAHASPSYLTAAPPRC